MSVPNAAVIPVNFLLDNLTQILVYNCNLIAGVRPNIVALQGELQTLQGLMKEFTNYNHDSDYVEKLVNEIRTVVHQAEDALDSYLIQSASQKTKPWILQAFNFDYAKNLRDLGGQIELIGEKIREINQYKVRILQYEAIRNFNKAIEAKEAPTVEEQHVIGFDEYAEQVQALLTTGVEELEVISIVGMLGLGKTTLARKVFKDPTIDYEYMIRAFVYVSKEYQKRDVLLKILTFFARPSDEVNKMDVDQLEKHLYKQLEGKQYLVVLDDVWDEKDWDRFKNAFPNNNKRCRVLITTRNEKVAKYANPRVPFYKLGFMPLETSRELLRWKVFGENNCPDELQEYELQIVKRCDGLPLAIVVLAGIILNHRDKIVWWKDVARTVWDYIASYQQQTTQVFNLMYKHLPSHLKPCFLYLGVFPEDFEIPVWRLVRLWIAEGLIQREPLGNLNLEDVAELYLEELVYRNLVIVGQKKSNDEIRTCRIGHFLSYFCKFKAKEENLFQEINDDKLPFFLSGNSALDQYRRLCINNANVAGYLSATPSGKGVRSFLSFSMEEIVVEPKLVFSISKTFQLLKVLEAQPLLLTHFPADALSPLVLLKYIAISTNSSDIPSAMSSVSNLQTLIVNTSSRRLEIKADIWKMPHFRHLHTNASTILPCPEDKNHKDESLIGKNVQTLSTIAPESCRKEVFDRTPNLKKLGVLGRLTNIEVSSLFESLRQLEGLENLKLLNDDLTSGFRSLPSEKSFPKKLTKLTLMNTILEWKEMSTLGKLENLEVLKLKDHAFQGKLWRSEKGGFIRLKCLQIGRTDLEIWEASCDHFLNLKRLELNHCDKLQDIPRGIADIPTLQLVALYLTNPSVSASARKLQVLRLEAAKAMGNKISSFKLTIYPPEH